MITAVCTDCAFGIRTLGDAREEELFVADGCEGLLHCPTCRKAMEVHTSISGAALSVMDVRDLTVEEAYKAMNGLGLPEDQECSPTAIRVAMQSPIAKLNIRPIRGTTRSIIESIELVSGAKVYLGASPHGAIVYRISNG